MTAPILFVAGFGRCGTTMVMTMLDKGGFPVAGPRPAYEVPQMALGRVDHAWVRAQAGRAVKWIDPLKAPIQPIDLQGQRAVIIALRRDEREQASSQVKMAAAFMRVRNDRRTRKAFQVDLTNTTPKMYERLHKLGLVSTFHFEGILADPWLAAVRLEMLIRDHFDVQFAATLAAQAVLHRSPTCAPDLSFELGLAGGAA